MTKRPPRRVYAPLPPGRVRPARLLWLIWGLATLAILGGGSAVFLSRVEVASQRSYVGELRPGRDPVVVRLPPGVVLGEILVDRGDRVARGQTVATLDPEAMARRAGEIEADLLLNTVLRDCLLTEGPPTVPEIEGLTPDLNSRVALAGEECKALRSEAAAIEEALEIEVSAIEEEVALVEDYIRVLTVTGPHDLRTLFQRQEDARRAVALALARNRLDAQIDELELKARQDTVKAQDKVRKRVRSLVDAIRRRTEARRKLLAWIETPRIRVPEAGQVIRIRALPRETLATELTDIVEIRPADMKGYTAEFELPPDQVNGVAIADRVRLRMLGLTGNNPDLFGRVVGLDTAPGGRVRASVTLEAESVAVLDDPRTGIALRGTGTASIVYVRKPGFTAVDLLRTHARSLVDPDWTLTRLRQILAADTAADLDDTRPAPPRDDDTNS